MKSVTSAFEGSLELTSLYVWHPGRFVGRISCIQLALRPEGWFKSSQMSLYLSKWFFFFLSFSKQASFHNHSHVLQLCVISRASCQGALRVTQTLSVLCRKSSCHWRMNLFIFNSYKSQLTLRQLMIIIRVFVPRHHQCLCVMLFHSPIAPTNCWLHAL